MKDCFQDTSTAFHYRSDKALKKAYLLFALMKYLPRFTVFLAQLGNIALRWKIPLVRTFIKNSFFSHFCGGETLEQCEPTIRNLSEYHVNTALDIGVEAQNSEEKWTEMARLITDTIVYAADKESIPVISLKITAVASFDLLKKYSKQHPLTTEETLAWNELKNQLMHIVAVAKDAEKILYVDAEESWIQAALDDLVLEMMIHFNRSKAIVFNTYQLYLKSSLSRLKEHHQKCLNNNCVFGAKLVRGAYMEKENQQANYLGIISPIQPSKKATDKAYNEAVVYCLNHYDSVHVCLASHNENSHEIAIEKIKKLKIDIDRVHFCQLYGMSDHLTFTLARLKYKALKYLPFGKVEETFPYLIRRAQENTSVAQQASKELLRIRKELRRRKFYA